MAQVYESSADICLRAQDLGEALKCLRQLVELIYPSLAAEQLTPADGAEPADPAARLEQHPRQRQAQQQQQRRGRGRGRCRQRCP